MRITNVQLRKLIKEEYDRITPTPRGQLMTEARANYLAEEIVKEFFGLGRMFKAAGAGAKAIGSEVGKKAGAAAGDAAKKLSNAAKAIAEPVQNAARSAAQGLASIADKGAKAAATQAANDMKEVIAKSLEPQVKKLIQELNAVGEHTDDEIKDIVILAINAGLAASEISVIKNTQIQK